MSRVASAKPTSAMTNFDEELQILKDKLLAMASHAESAVSRAIRALTERDEALAQQVRKDDKILDRYEIEIVDVFRDPKRALADRIFMTPTLVRLAPAPVLRIVGTLSHTLSVLQALGLEPALQ